MLSNRKCAGSPVRDCDVDLTGQHGNRKRCPECASEHQREQQAGWRRDRSECVTLLHHIRALLVRAVEQDDRTALYQALHELKR